VSPYDPGATPVREMILRDLETAIEAIAPPTYKSTVRSVTRYGFDRTAQVETPAVCIGDFGQDTNDRRFGILSHELRVSLLLAYEGDDWRSKVLDLASDVRVAIMLDVTRGGRAVDTRIASERVFDAEAASPAGTAQLDLVIPYRTILDDPTTPK
jgi:hypothetical protein